MRDRIDERNEKERISRSIVKFWNVNYVTKPAEDEVLEDEAAKIIARLAKEAAEDEAAKQAEIDAAMEEARRKEALYNATTGSFSGEYGMDAVDDEVTKGQIDKILQEKNEALRDLIEHSDDYFWEES